jgi:hypothetical protein
VSLRWLARTLLYSSVELFQSGRQTNRGQENLMQRRKGKTNRNSREKAQKVTANGHESTRIQIADARGFTQIKQAKSQQGHKGHKVKTCQSLISLHLLALSLRSFAAIILLFRRSASHLSSIALATEEARQRSTGGGPYSRPFAVPIRVHSRLDTPFSVFRFADPWCTERPALNELNQ